MCSPQSWSVIDLAFPTINIMLEVVLIEIRGVTWELEFSNPEGCNWHRNYVPSRSFGCAYFVVIYWCAYTENDQRQ